MDLVVLYCPTEDDSSTLCRLGEAVAGGFLQLTVRVDS